MLASDRTFQKQNLVGDDWVTVGTALRRKWGGPSGTLGVTARVSCCERARLAPSCSLASYITTWSLPLTLQPQCHLPWCNAVAGLCQGWCYVIWTFCLPNWELNKLLVLVTYPQVFCRAMENGPIKLSILPHRVPVIKPQISKWNCFAEERERDFSPVL